MNDNNFYREQLMVHQHKYSYQDGKWHPIERNCYIRYTSEWSDWYDCNSTLNGDNFHGCWEKE